MSEPSYRINTERTYSTLNPWEARVTRLSDGEFVQQINGSTEDECLAVAREWIATVNGYRDISVGDGSVYFAAEDGSITEGAAA